MSECPELECQGRLLFPLRRNDSPLLRACSLWRRRRVTRTCARELISPGGQQETQGYVRV
eukprot:652937-Pyramimonas_sp.AAC.1